jgi:predicted small lipoprotein YifL
MFPMPILPAAPLPSPAPQPAPHVVPPAQKVTPVEPARRVTKGKEGGRSELDADEEKRRQRQQDEQARGGLYDIEA